MSPRTKVRSASKLRRDERMMREMLAWRLKNVPNSTCHCPRCGYVIAIDNMIKQAFMAGWKSRDLGDWEPAVGSRFDEVDPHRETTTDEQTRAREQRLGFLWGA